MQYKCGMTEPRQKDYSTFNILKTFISIPASFQKTMCTFFITLRKLAGIELE